MASITQQQIALAKPPTPVILSSTERQSREVKSKDSEVVSLAKQFQGVLTRMRPQGFFCLLSSHTFVSSSLPLTKRPKAHHSSRHHHFNTAVPGKPISYFPVVFHVEDRHVRVFSGFQAAFPLL